MNQINGVFADFLATQLEGPGLTKQELDKAVDAIRAGYFNRCKINQVVSSSENPIVEICCLNLNDEKLAGMLVGPDFPENLNKNHTPSPLQVFDLKIVLPQNLVEMFVLYNYLRSEMRISDEKFLFTHQIEPFIGEALASLKDDISGDNLSEIIPNIWLAFGEPLRVSQLL